MEQTPIFHAQNRNRVAIIIGSGVLHQALLLPIFDSDSIDDRKLAANHLAQILNTKVRKWNDDNQSYWRDLKATFMPTAADYDVAQETATLAVMWLRGVAAQPGVQDPFEGLF